MLISKLPGMIMKRWNEKFLIIERSQVRRNFIEDETILMNDPLFSRKTLADYHMELEQPAKQKKMQS